MLKISKLADYAVIILSLLARDTTRVANAAVVAEEAHLALPTVSKILKMLGEAKLVISFRGQRGGYQLGKNAEHITLADVIVVMEGQQAMTECCSQHNACVLDALCSVKENWQVINQKIFSVLAELTISDMMRPLKQSAPSFHGIPVMAGQSP
jgi:FeS assembly SUF system regulator